MADEDVDASAAAHAAAQALEHAQFVFDDGGLWRTIDVSFAPGESVADICTRVVATGVVPCYADASLRASLGAYLAARAEVCDPTVSGLEEHGCCDRSLTLTRLAGQVHHPRGRSFLG